MALTAVALRLRTAFGGPQSGPSVRSRNAPGPSTPGYSLPRPRLQWTPCQLQWWDPLLGLHATPHTPGCLRHRGQQAQLVRSTTVEPARRAVVCVRTRRTLTTAVVIPARFECKMAILRGQQVAHRQGAVSQRRSRCRDGWSGKRREQPRTSPFPCLALSGAQRPSPAVGNARHESPAKEEQLRSRSVNGRWQ